jgi:hypothetical protein
VTPDYFEMTWSPSRGQAIVRSTCDEIPWAECDEAAHQLLAVGNMARRINTPPTLDIQAGAGVTVTTVASTGPFPSGGCGICTHSEEGHDMSGCTVRGCGCRVQRDAVVNARPPNTCSCGHTRGEHGRDHCNLCECPVGHE